MARASGSYPEGHWFKSNYRYHFFSPGPLVKRSRHRPFTAVTGVRFPHGSPNGSLAQLGEHLPYKQRVSGSSPLTSTNMEAPTKVGAFSFVYPLLISFLTAEFVICQPAKGQRFEPVNFHHKDIPKGMSFFIFLKQSVKFFRRSCGADAGGEIDPFPRGGDFRPRRAGAFFAAFGGGGVRTLRRAGENCCRAAAGVCKRGYRTPLKTGFRP